MTEETNEPQAEMPIDPTLSTKKPIKKNKVYNNSYESTEINTSKQEFKLDSSVTSNVSEDELIDQKIIYKEIHRTVKETKFEKFNIKDANGSYKKLNKSDINELYLYVTSKNPLIPKIEIFSVLSDYFDINYTKFYDSLSNKFKSELIEELKQSTSVGKLFGSQLF